MFLLPFQASFALASSGVRLDRQCIPLIVLAFPLLKGFDPRVRAEKIVDFDELRSRSKESSPVNSSSW